MGFRGQMFNAYCHLSSGEALFEICLCFDRGEPLQISVDVIVRYSYGYYHAASEKVSARSPSTLQASLRPVVVCRRVIEPHAVPISSLLTSSVSISTRTISFVLEKDGTDIKRTD
jgi:hypothetical protein